MESTRLYSFLWLLPFLYIQAWVLTCLTPGLRRNTPVRRRIAVVLVAIWSSSGIIYLWLLHRSVGLSWLQISLLVFLWLALAGLLRAPAIRSQRLWVRLRNTLAWWGYAAHYVLIGIWTGHGIWFVGSSVLAAASLWNTYSEWVLRASLESLLIGEDQSKAWRTFFLPEELPILPMLWVAFAFYPFPLGDVSSTTLRAGLELAAVPVATLFVTLLVLALAASTFVRDDTKRAAIVRLVAGLAILLGIAMTLGFTASRLSPARLHFSFAALARSSAGAVPAHGGDVLPLCVWSGATSLAIGVLATLMVLIGYFARGARYDVFLSFCSADRSQAQIIVDMLRQLGLRYFFSDESVHPGDPFKDRIRAAIRSSRVVLVLLTPRSRFSDYVRFEWSDAMAIDKPLVLVILDMGITDIPVELQHLQVLEFAHVGGYLVGLRRQRPKG